MQEYTNPSEYTIPDDLTAVDSVFLRAKHKPNNVAFRRQSGTTWTEISFAQFEREVVAVAKGLIALGVNEGDRIGIMSATRYEWSLLDFSIWAAGAVTVPIYETSAADQVKWILDDSAAVLLFVENGEHEQIAQEAAVDASNLRRIARIVPEAGGTPIVDELKALGADGDEAEVRRRVDALVAESPATLIYTSGTTGRPKGCVLTHRNFLGHARGVQYSTLGDLLAGPNIGTLMFLPFAHILARAVAYAVFDTGSATGHTSDTKNLPAVFGSFKPDFILAVPRVFEKIYNGARAQAQAGGKGKIFDRAVDIAIKYSEALDQPSVPLGLRVQHFVYDKLVYGRLKEAMGGQCQLSICGGAPLGARLGHFFRGVGVPIYEGYGLTETTSAITVNTIDHQKIGTSGRPLQGNSVAIADDGEILLKGNVVYAGYWNNPQATEEATVDGWFHSGDLGSLDADGYLTITGRKKEILVTAGGKNVSPAQMEDALRADPLISQALVVGDQKPFIAALITLDEDELPKWVAKHGKPEGSTAADLLTDPDLIAHIDNSIAKANTLVSHAESIKKYRILPTDFTEDSGEMTPTLKLKRNVITAKRSADIDQIYA